MAVRIATWVCVAQGDPRLGYTPPAAPAASLAVIPFTPGKPIYVDARINGTENVRLLLDTGADGTIIASRILRAAGLAPRTGSATLRGVTGHATAVDAYEIASLEVGGARVGRLTVLGHDTAEPGSDGLLGRDFLEHFTVTIDNAAGQVTLTPK
jgi:predicted aspartyl protease